MPVDPVTAGAIGGAYIVGRWATNTAVHELRGDTAHQQGDLENRMRVMENKVEDGNMKVEDCTARVKQNEESAAENKRDQEREMEELRKKLDEEIAARERETAARERETAEREKLQGQMTKMAEKMNAMEGTQKSLERNSNLQEAKIRTQEAELRCQTRRQDLQEEDLNHVHKKVDKQGIRLVKAEKALKKVRGENLLREKTDMRAAYPLNMQGFLTNTTLFTGDMESKILAALDLDIDKSAVSRKILSDAVTNVTKAQTARAICKALAPRRELPRGVQSCVECKVWGTQSDLMGRCMCWESEYRSATWMLLNFSNSSRKWQTQSK
ncbi:unnamed protein product [Amoebophrya sp. A120]|nr:unnamed protein product [Amoebophrya sp. A120]|eukprot:GSA120T00021983001.1